MMVLLALVLVIFGLIALVAWQQQQFGLREKDWVAERSQLLTRLQHPEVVPIPADDRALGQQEAAELFNAARTEPNDDIDLVGTVQDHGSTE